MSKSIPPAWCNTPKVGKIPGLRLLITVKIPSVICITRLINNKLFERFRLPLLFSFRICINKMGISIQSKYAVALCKTCTTEGAKLFVL